MYNLADAEKDAEHLETLRREYVRHLQILEIQQAKGSTDVRIIIGIEDVKAQLDLLNRKKDALGKIFDLLSHKAVIKGFFRYDQAEIANIHTEVVAHKESPQDDEVALLVKLGLAPKYDALCGNLLRYSEKEQNITKDVEELYRKYQEM